MDHESVKLVDRWRGGDELAAGEIYDRYVSRLIALAASRLSPTLARRIEAEDIVQSVYRSFFARTGEDRLQVQQSGQLWGLLAAITLNKVRAQARFHQADKRSVTAEASINASRSCYGLAPADLAGEPTADEAAILAEQYHLAAQKMTPVGKQVFELYLQNTSVPEIAKAVRRSERTVRRELEQIRKLLTEMLESRADA
ncbi:RNA polymerase sigma factor [Crateriforma spongiae]|uniref:RNA polymerase sigma factor n=1 Tax=Crateriforma spongiae TaxID=2724528 RepID=UPI001444A0F8|nr:sigma-70 family RNA polymerase sigma factor [Crateriforma spongiae]